MTYCCAPAAPVTPTPTSQAPTMAPTSICSTITASKACFNAAPTGCVWYGSVDRCQQSGYCNPSWTQSQCELPLSAGSCLFQNGQCLPRTTVLPTINIGYECSGACNVNASIPFRNQPCTFCGSQGVCCDPANPVGCRLPAGTYPLPICAEPGSWGPSASPTLRPTPMPSASPTVRPSQNPSFTPSRSPSSSRPSRVPSKSPSTSKPSANPSRSPSVSKPSVSPTFAPTLQPTLQPTSDAPSLAPTRQPTFFGSAVELVSTTGQYEPDIHGSQAFSDFICDIWTRYWFPASAGCDRSKMKIVIASHGSYGRRLDTAPLEPSVDVVFSTVTIPENVSAVSMGHSESNKELARRAASLQFKIAVYAEYPITNAPAGTSGAASNNALSTTSWMYIGIGIGLFGLFILIAVVLLTRRRSRSSDRDDATSVSGYSRRTDRGYPPSQAYRRKDLYISQQPKDVLTVRGKDFRTVPPTSKDYVAEEAGNIFAVSQRELPTASQRNALALERASQEQYAALPAPPPARVKSFSRRASQRSDYGNGDERPSLPRQDSRRSEVSNGNGSDPAEYRTREESLYRHQMAPYFGGRADGDEDLDSIPPSTRGRLSQYSQSSDRGYNTGSLRRQTTDNSYSGNPPRNEAFSQANPVGNHGMSDWM